MAGSAAKTLSPGCSWSMCFTTPSARWTEALAGKQTGKTPQNGTEDSMKQTGVAGNATEQKSKQSVQFSPEQLRGVGAQFVTPLTSLHITGESEQMGAVAAQLLQATEKYTHAACARRQQEGATLSQPSLDPAQVPSAQPIERDMQKRQREHCMCKPRKEWAPKMVT